MPTATASRVAKPDKREAILDAARDLFAERGFHGTAVPLVAKTAGVGAGTIYRYFESKERLVNVLYRREKQAVLDFVMAGFPFALAPRQQFHHFFERVLGYAEAEPASFRFLEHHHHAPYLDGESLALEGRAMSMALGFLEQASAAGLTKDVAPPVLIALVWGGLVRLMKEAWEGQLELTEAVRAEAEEVFWEAVRR